MKKGIGFLIIGFLSLASCTSFAQKEKKFEDLKVSTSAQCEMCKETIEEALAFVKGVKHAELDLESKIVTVTYRKGKTNPEKIRTAISRAGYDADHVAAYPKAYKKLPACCKKPEDQDRIEHK